MKMTEWGVERETKQGLKTQGWIYSTFAHSISAQTPVSNLTTSNPSELIIDCTYSQNWMVFACWCLMGKKKMLLLTFCIDQMIGKGEQESSRTCFFLVHQNSTAQTGTFFFWSESWMNYSYEVVLLVQWYLDGGPSGPQDIIAPFYCFYSEQHVKTRAVHTTSAQGYSR